MNSKLLRGARIILLAALIPMAYTQCTKDDTPAQPEPEFTQAELEALSVDTRELQQKLDELPIEDLSQAEIDGIAFMREEEKLARDVYLKLKEKWGLQVFNNISASEQTHMDAVEMLTLRYDLDDPAAGNPVGVFVDEQLQALYDDLIAQGYRSMIEALKVGALIEETDIIDIQYQLDEYVDNRDIEMVYSNLLRGSRNHLRAFVRNLKVRKVTYEPVYLDQDLFDDIINSEIEVGGP